MTHFLPLFPLNLVVFPGEVLKLHIFEERYKQLTHECVEGNTTFGIPPVLDKTLTSIATELTILSVDKRYASGELDITTQGMGRVRIENFYEVSRDKLYPGGDVVELQDIPETDSYLQEKMWKLLAQLHQALGITHKDFPSAKELTIFQVGHQMGLSLKQEFELLSLNSERDRLLYAIRHLEAVIPVVEETERLKAKVKLNGHYKNVIPPDFNG